ncbi:MAG: hypothetical protein ACYDHX_07320 [Methanothrix sp.]
MPPRKSGFLHEAVSGNDADHGKLREMVQAPAGALPRPRARAGLGAGGGRRVSC